MPGVPARAATVTEMVDALLLYDEPALNHRFHDILSRAPPSVVSALRRVPDLVAEAERSTRKGAVLWERASEGTLTAEFLDRGERMLLEGFLALTEAQIRMLTFIAHEAPTPEVRAHFDQGLDLQRKVTGILRDTIPQIGADLDEEPKGALRSVQEETAGGSFRQQIENAILASREAKKFPRLILLSHVGLRHLRDEGSFSQGKVDVLGVPVVVDWGWEAPAFVLQTFSSTPLEALIERGKLPDRAGLRSQESAKKKS